ncbi:Nucleolar protein 12 [Penicillium cosmopolitanum]|uniref:Nucleolar protein 12 n=1 Tax=Penicillium cosmopolitanum TaxID=1131564 RepID=A0A9X0B8N2_9EURO|nr:Nucleolar protein 12 [Penicillium cosmopolitanum]KAJ5392270.1 Nucleolar protein 12 [Penicillium cosmopolitanum]
MGKKSSKSQSKEESQPAAGGLPFISGSASLDPTLSSLFASSSGPVQAPTIKYKKDAAARKSAKKTDEVEEEDDDVMEDASASEESDSESAEENAEETQGRKRKRGPAEEVEETYMRRIAKEEEKDAAKRKAEYAKRQKADDESDDKSDNSDDEEESEDKDKDSDDEEKAAPPPVHESVSGNAKASEVEKSSRTVFLGNVSTEAIKSKSSKKTLLRHLASHLSSLPESSGPHKVESIRFRSVPFASGGGLPKRASFARREILDDTTPSTNAYAVYTTIQGARKAPSALNGTVVLDRHIRVDSIAHPAEIDNKRCVFVGNLDFVDQEGITEDHNGKKKKARASADIEEGLWRIFNQNTGDTKDKKTVKKNVEFVRVIRDRATRVGKGFAYKNYPPMLPRKLRVTRARKMAKKQEDDGGKNGRRGDLAQKTLQGRASKLLGRAGAAKMKEAGKGGIAGNSMVFEGHRATEDGSRMKVKTKSRGSKGKPKGRSSKRAAAYRAAGGQKP